MARNAQVIAAASHDDIGHRWSHDDTFDGSSSSEEPEGGLRMQSHVKALLIAIGAALVLLGSRPMPVSAECPYLPPWPELTSAIPTARAVIIGEIVTDFDHSDLHLGPDQGLRDYALRVTEVLRGRARPGDLIDVQYLLPNWPQTRFPGSDGLSTSCTYLRSAPGEVIALAFDALQPGGQMTENDQTWVQPPTRYNAVGVITVVESGEAYTWYERERVSLKQVRDLAALPSTDTTASQNGPADTLPLAFLLGLFGGLFTYRRLTTDRDADPPR